MTQDRDAAINALLDKDALRELAMRYARAIDRHDPDLLRTVYHDDATDSHGAAFTGSAATFIEQLPGIMAGYELTAHYIINTSYRLDGDRADGELYFIAYHRTLHPTSQHITVTGRYLDNYERRAGQWKIARRQLVWDSLVATAVAPSDAAQLATLGIVGGKADDFSYDALPLMGRGA